MAASNGSSPPRGLLPPWLSGSNPSVTLSLASSTAAPPAWMQQRGGGGGGGEGGGVVAELVECCRELEEGHRAWAAQKKEALWRVSRVEAQLESEKACRRREKMEEVEAKVKALREEQQAALDRIEADYRDQLAGLRRDADAKEQKLAEQWAAKHARLANFLDHLASSSRASERGG